MDVVSVSDFKKNGEKMQKVVQDKFLQINGEVNAMPIQKYVSALRQNVSRSLSYYERSNHKRTKDIAQDVKSFLISKNIDDSTITKTDITRCKNVTGGKDGKGVSISVTKLGILERFLKENNCWRQYVQAVQTKEERYYANVAETLCKSDLAQDKVIEGFYTRRANVERGSEPEIIGHYEVIRRSMHSLGKFNRSRIRFYQNSLDTNIYEFREERLITKRAGSEYTVFFDGFMNFIRNTYILQGHSFIEGDGISHYTPFPETMYIHNDRDVNRLVGIWTSVTRENSHPCSSPVVMRKVPEAEFTGCKLGLVDNPEEEIEGFDIRTFDGSIDSDKGMLYIDGHTSVD